MNDLKLKDIVVIDDNSEDLDAIVSALRQANQFVIPFLYKNDESSTLEILRSCVTSEKIIRCIITDINLVEGSTFDPSNAAKHIADNILREFITSDSKNYILFVWTSKDTEQEFNVFKDTLNKSLQQHGIKNPLNIVQISKNACKRGLSYDPQKILNFIKEAMKNDQNKAILQLIDWEKKCEIATAETIETLINNFENTSQVLYKLLRELGGENALHEPEQIVNILLLLLKDNLNKIATEKNIRGIWSDLFENTTDEQKIKISEKAKINTILHIDTSAQSSDIICPGDFFELRDNNVLNYCFFKALNKPPKGFYFDKCFDFAITNQDFEGKTKKEIKNKKKIQFFDGFKTGLLEISAGCDFANNKKKANLYVLSFIAPKIEGLEFARYDSEISKNKKVQESILNPLLIELEGELYYLFIDVNYIFSLSSEFIKSKNFLGQERLAKLFRLRESYLQHWVQQVANHNSRIGTISFKL